jgi:recombination protein RecT
MSTQALKAAATGQETAEHHDKPKTIAALLVDPQIKSQMALALPRHVTADRLARIALTEVRKNPKLAQCDQTSFLGAVMQCAALGLEPGGALGHCYLIPFENRRKGRTEVQFIVGYRGMIDLARRSGQIVSLEARAVYAKDKFEVELGLDSRIVHKPDWDAEDRGDITFVYAVAKLRDGGIQFDVMSRREIERVRNASAGYRVAEAVAKKYNKTPDSPWHSHFEEMAKKTVVRRLFKYLPVSIEIQRAVGLDEQAEIGITQDSPLMIEQPPGGFLTAAQESAMNEAAEQAGIEGGASAVEIMAALKASADRDSLDVAGDMIRMLPEAEQEPLAKLYEQRAKEFDA